MVDFYLDDRTVGDRRALRTQKLQHNQELHMPGLEAAIAKCRADGDATFRHAIAHWIGSLAGRDNMDLSKTRRLQIPNVLREALGLNSQNVILEGGSLWYAVDGGKERLLYSPTA